MLSTAIADGRVPTCGLGCGPARLPHAVGSSVQGSRNKEQRIQRELWKLKASGDYRLLHCQGGAVVLQRQVPDTAPGQLASSGSSSSCPWLE